MLVYLEVTLTDAQVKAAKPALKTARLSDAGGLHLEVNPQGGKYWVWRHRFPPMRAGKPQDYRIGPYPKVSLKKAREVRDEQKRRLYEEGINPCLAKKQNKIERYRPAQVLTFESVAREWHEIKTQGKWGERHSNDVLQKLVRDILPMIGPIEIRNITTPDCLGILRRIEKRQSLEQAKRTLGVVSQVCDYACALGYLSSNPAHPLRREAPIKQTKDNHPAIKWEELPELINALNTNEVGSDPLTRNGLRLLMLTFPRTNELIAAAWDEINWTEKIWTVPAERMKGARGSRKEHLIPLSDKALEIFKELYEITGPDGYIFKSMRTKTGYMSNNTMNMALKRMGFDKRMCGHGFRSFAMTNIQEKLKISLRIAKRQHAHIEENKVTAAYNRAEYLDERIDMMNKWAALLVEQGLK
ncbi:integrase arm-type DNA-binding domain-containing protein [Synechococcus sp. CS-1329]|uniref:tyrosine-type recombinase/integrase n=1 Tax=Synechococcus sp. CS-1329 TaxID=2847975 RepID=UPI00223AAD6E|nr:integrase arm-type DNA-binding domain-containing protein [Synechococcus sp. CS-1329]MCT0219499.1 integrase arm-type DNA-binding domain-containing protein [Synechococcus sp. CS-1329]